MTQQGTALQYSVFLVTGVESSVRELLAQLEALMDTRVDDVRAYRLPHDLKVWKLGRQSFPDGVVLAGSDAVRSLLQVDDQLAMGIPLVEEDTTCNIDD